MRIYGSFRNEYEIVPDVACIRTWDEVFNISHKICLINKSSARSFHQGLFATTEHHEPKLVNNRCRRREKKIAGKNLAFGKKSICLHINCWCIFHFLSFCLSLCQLTVILPVFQLAFWEFYREKLHKFTCAQASEYVQACPFVYVQCFLLPLFLSFFSFISVVTKNNGRQCG